MLKNLSPVLTGKLLSALDGMAAGDELVLASGAYPGPAGSRDVVALGGTTTEEAAGAILSVLPLGEEAASPIIFHDGRVGDRELPDVAFAVRGLAADAERRRIELVQVGGEDFSRLATGAVLTVQAEADAEPCAFLLRRGIAG